jgi:hypothetical protein
MTSVFMISAAVGATFLVLQFLLGLVGLGGDALGVDTPHDFGHDLGGADHDFSGDVHGEIAHDGSASGDHAESQHSSASQAHHGSAWLFRALSLRTITAALAFFGLAGMAAQSADYPPFESLVIAIAAGVAALYAVYAMLSATRSLRADGTVRIQRALGKEATVYLRIPAKRSGAGKIQMNLQNRTVEYLAMTPDDAIPSGAIVVVTGLLGSDTVQVQPVTKSL